MNSHVVSVISKICSRAPSFPSIRSATEVLLHYMIPCFHYTGQKIILFSLCCFVKSAWNKILKVLEGESGKSTQADRNHSFYLPRRATEQLHFKVLPAANFSTAFCCHLLNFCSSTWKLLEGLISTSPKTDSFSRLLLIKIIFLDIPLHSTGADQAWKSGYLMMLPASGGTLEFSTRQMGTAPH